MKQFLDKDFLLQTETAKALQKTIEDGVPCVCKGGTKELPISPRTITVSFDITLPGTIEEVKKEVENNLKYSLFKKYTNVEIKEV